MTIEAFISRALDYVPIEHVVVTGSNAGHIGNADRFTLSEPGIEDHPLVIPTEDRMAVALLRRARHTAAKPANDLAAVGMGHQRHVVSAGGVVGAHVTLVADDERVISIRLYMARPPAGQQVLADPRAVWSHESVVIFHASLAFDFILNSNFTFTRKVLAHAELSRPKRVKRFGLPGQLYRSVDGEHPLLHHAAALVAEQDEIRLVRMD
jgi:hypothetical protein